MKRLLLLLIFSASAISFAQHDVTLGEFDALDSNIGAKINIVKSSQYKVLLKGEAELLGHIDFEVVDRSLKIRSDNAEVDFEEVLLTVYTPSLAILNVSDGGKATMDSSFSRIDHIEVAAIRNAVVDLSGIQYTTLVANSVEGGQIIYKDQSTPF